MNLKEKMEKFNKRWKIQTELDSKQEFQKFRIRVLNFLNDIDNHIKNESISTFCQFYGISENWDISSSHRRSTNIINRLKDEDREVELYKLLEVIFSLDINTTVDFNGATVYNKNILLKKLKDAIHFSNINLAVSEDKSGEIIFYPQGEAVFDKELVDKVLSFLEGNSNSHFVEALKFYQDKKWIKSAESLRRTTEEFLREKMENKKGLKGNIQEVGVLLKNKKIDSQIRSVANQVLAYLDQYFDENSKHNDGKIEEADNEFLIYQTGLLLRYLNKIL